MKTQRQKMEYNGLKIAILIASLVSFYTTFSGMYAVSDLDPDEPFYASTIMIFMVVFLIQVSLIFGLRYFAWRKLFSRETSLKAMAALVMYIGTAILSVTFSFAFYYEKISAVDHAQRSMNIQIKKVDQTLLKASDTMNLAVSSLRALSQYSLKQSEKEQNEGGTCSPKKLVGYGDLTQIRIDDSDITKKAYLDIEMVSKNMSEDIKKLRQQIASFSERTRVEDMERTINEAIKNLNTFYLRKETFASVEKELESRSGTNRRHLLGFNKKRQEEFVRPCVDKGFTKEVTKVLNRLDAIKPLEEVNLFNPHDKKQLLERTGNVLLAVVGLKEVKDVNKITSPDDITNKDLHALSFAVFIDTLIFLLSIIDKEPLRRRKFAIEKVKAIMKGDAKSSVYQQLRPFLYEGISGYLVAIPKNMKVGGIDHLMQYLKSKGLAKVYISNIHASKLPKSFKNLVEPHQNSDFTLYRMGNREMEELVLAEIAGEIE